MSNAPDEFLVKELKKFLGTSADLNCEKSNLFFAPFQNVSNVNFFLRKEADEEFFAYGENHHGLTVSAYLQHPSTIAQAKIILAEVKRIEQVNPLHDIKYGQLLRNLEAHPAITFQQNAVFV